MDTVPAASWPRPLIACGSVEAYARRQRVAAAACTGGAGAAHVVALRPVGRCDEFAKRECQLRDVCPELHSPVPVRSDVPSDWPA